MKRKVIQIANSTQLISLPRNWTKRFNIQKGDELEVQEKGTSVSINTDKFIDTKSREVDISRLSETTIKKLLYGLYTTGYAEIKVNFDNTDSLNIIQDVLMDEMIGYEIIEQKEHYVIAKSIAGGFETEFDNMLRRAFILLKTMAEGILEAMKKGDPKTLASIRQLEVNNNKYIAFCGRILAKRGYSDFEKTIFMYGIINELEKSADQLKYLCHYLTESKDNIKNQNDHSIDFFEQVVRYLDDAYILYYNFDVKKADVFFIRRKELIKKGIEVSKKKTKERGKTRGVFYAINLIQNLSDMMARKMESML